MLTLCVCLFLACAVSAMLCEVAGSGVSSKVSSSSVDGERVKGDMEFDVVLCQSELTERALQLCHLLPPGFMPVSLNSYHTSHTQTSVSFNWCLMELNSHSSSSGAPVSGREKHHMCVCLGVGVPAPSDWPLRSRIWARNPIAFIFLQHLLFLLSMACSYVSPPIPHQKNNIPALILLLAISYSARLTSATSRLPYICLLRYAMGWSCLCL